MPPKHAKALHHHAKAGDAIKAGDISMAMHHTGHLLSALRHGERSASLSTPAKAPPLDMSASTGTPAAPSPFGGMRGRLAKMKP